jgi:hypothetical protein
VKTNCLILVVLLAAAIAGGQTYNSPLRIESFTRSGQLELSNTLCPALPVYEVLRASCPTGNWQHFFYVTNTDTLTLTNSLGSSPGAVFHKLALIGDSPMTFDYSFEDGSGVGPSVVGQLRLGMVNVNASNSSWTFYDVLYLGGPHPIGSGSFYSGGLARNESGAFLIRLKFTSGSEGIFLEGRPQSARVNGECVTTGLTGVVYLSGFAGTTPMGSFTATRVFP